MRALLVLTLLVGCAAKPKPKAVIFDGCTVTQREPLRCYCANPETRLDAKTGELCVKCGGAK